MLLFMLALLPSLIASAAALPQPEGTYQKPRIPTLYLAGDSTMAKYGGGVGTGTDGWGQYLGYSLKIPVVNNAIGGRSARSFTVEGRFQSIIDTVQWGDYVVIEFGHNDGGSLNGTTDNGRTDCPGDGDETCVSPTTGDTVYTFVHYEVEAGKALQAKGANVIISSQTPNNPWETGSFVYEPTRFVGYAEEVAKAIGSAYIDHGQYVANRYESLGLDTVDSFFPNDHTHTSTQGADVVSAAFVKGLLCSRDHHDFGYGHGLAALVKNASWTIPGFCV